MLTREAGTALQIAKLCEVNEIVPETLYEFLELTLSQISEASLQAMVWAEEIFLDLCASCFN